MPSHCNTSTSLDATFAYTAAAGGAVILVTSIGLAAASVRAHPDVSPTMVIGIGCASYVLAAGAVVMTSQLGIDPLTAPALVPTGLGSSGTTGPSCNDEHVGFRAVPSARWLDRAAHLAPSLKQAAFT